MTSIGSQFLASVMLWLIYVAVAIAIAATLFSLYHSSRQRSTAHGLSCGIPTARLAWGVALGVMACLAVTFLLGSTQPILTNGHPFTSAHWLRVADMFIFTSFTLIIICSVGVLISRFRS